MTKKMKLRSFMSHHHTDDREEISAALDSSKTKGEDVSEEDH